MANISEPDNMKPMDLSNLTKDLICYFVVINMMKKRIRLILKGKQNKFVYN